MLLRRTRLLFDLDGGLGDGGGAAAGVGLADAGGSQRCTLLEVLRGLLLGELGQDLGWRAHQGLG